MRIIKGPHYEADIAFTKDERRGIVVTKKYRLDVACIAWLNKHLSNYYPAEGGLPVAQHEFAALTLLAKHGVAPRPIEALKHAIVMEFAGRPVAAASLISFKSYMTQCQNILTTLGRLNFRHNDLLPANVVVRRGRLKIIDFTLSEFNGIEIMNALPEPGWARPGQDEAIASYLPRGLPRCRQAIVEKLRCQGRRGGAAVS